MAKIFFKPFLEYVGKIENAESDNNIVFYENDGDGRTVIYPIETFDEYDRKRYDLPNLPFKPRSTDWKFKIHALGNAEPLVIYDGRRLRPKRELINSKGVLVRRYSAPVGVIVKIISHEGTILSFKPIIRYCHGRNDYWIDLQTTNEGLPSQHIDWLNGKNSVTETNEVDEDAVPVQEAITIYQQYRAENPPKTKPR